MDRTHTPPSDRVSPAPRRRTGGRVLRAPRAAFRTLAARVEIGVLAGVLGVAASLLVFVWLAGAILEGDTAAFDERILRALRAPGDPADPIGPRWFEEMARDVTALGSTIVLTLVALGVVGFLVMLSKRGAAVLVLASVSGGTVLSYLLKAAFDRPRPDLVPHGATVYTASFPSSHAMLSAVVYLTLGALLARVQPRRRLKIYLLCVPILITAAVGLSRVYLGVHWPTDVLAGWCAGAGWAAVCWLAALRLQRRGAVEPEGRPRP